MNDIVQDVALFFKALGSETRLRILSLLFKGPKSVNEISELMGSDLALSSISTQLNLLYRMKLVTFKRIGRTKVYQLHDKHVAHILNDAILHVLGGDNCDEIMGCQEENYDALHYLLPNSS